MYGELDGVGVFFVFEYFVDVVDVVVYQVFVEVGGWCQGFFQVYLVVYFQVLEGGVCQVFVVDVGLEVIVGQFYCGQVDVVDCDVVVEFDVVQVEFVGGDVDLQVVVFGCYCVDVVD